MRILIDRFGDMRYAEIIETNNVRLSIGTRIIINDETSLESHEHKCRAFDFQTADKAKLAMRELLEKGYAEFSNAQEDMNIR